VAPRSWRSMSPQLRPLTSLAAAVAAAAVGYDSCSHLI
jgi:hypothetical protein